MKHCISPFSVSLRFVALALFPALSGHGATLIKADTATMNTAADWGGTEPGPEHIGGFNSTLSAANAASLVLGADMAFGGLIFYGGMLGPTTIGAGNTLTLGASGIDMSGAHQAVTLSNDVALAESQTWNLGRNLTANGVIGGASEATLTKSGGSLLTLTASNTYAGATLINAGTFTLNGPTAAIANSDITLAYGTTFNINSLPGIPMPSVVRGKGLTVNGATILPIGPGSNDVHDVFTGPFTIGSGYTVMTVNPDAVSYKNVRLTFGSLARPAGGGVILFRGTQLGASPLASRAAKQGNIEFVEPPALVGGGGAYGTVTNSIIPFAVGGEWNHLWNDYFVTYDSANGLRRITTYATSLTDGSTSANNVHLTAAVSGMNGVTTLNALKLGTGGSVDGTGELRLASGALLASKNSSIGTNTPGTLAFGDAEGIVSMYDSTVTLTVGSAVTGNKGMTKATLGTLSLVGPVDVGDPIRFISGTLNVGGAVTGPLSVSRSATFNLLAGAAVTGAVDLSVSSTGNSSGGTLVGSLTQDGGTFNLSAGSAVIGSLAVVGSTVNITNSAVSGEVVVGPNSRLGNLYLNNGGTVAGVVSIQSGTFNLRTGGEVSGVITNLGSFNFSGVSDYTLDTPFDGSGTLYQLSTTGTLTLRQAAGGHAIGKLAPSSGTTLELDGAGDAYTTVNNRLDPAGATFSVLGGTWDFNMGSVQNSGNIRIHGGTLTATPDSTRFSIGCANGSTFVMTGGILTVPSTVSWGLRFGNIHGAWHDSGYTFTGAQSGGLILNNGASGLEVGSLTLNKTNTYDLSGGVLYSWGGVQIGSGTNGASLASFTLRDSGKLVSRMAISGRQAYPGTRQVFDFQGGTLAAAEYQAAYLWPAAGAATGTLFNAGGTLAPGDIGTAGMTWITGNYTSAPNAVLAFDIGGAAQAYAFTNGPGYYDYVYVNGGYAALDGTLRISLINGFVPEAGHTFDVLACTGAGAALSGGFSNTPGSQVWATDGYSRLDVTNDAVNMRVRLSHYALNQWSTASGGAWTDSGVWSLSEPDGSAYAAYFGGTLTSADTVTLDTVRTLRGVAFNNAVSYTIAGSGALTLSGDATTAAQITVAEGSHTIALPLTLTDALSVEVTGAASALTLSGTVTGGQALTKTGEGVLTVSGDQALGVVTVSGGEMRMTRGTSAFDALSVANGAVFSFGTGSLTLADGLTVAVGGAFNFQVFGGGALLLARGSDGGAIDTAAEVLAAITDGRITVKGQAADVSVFVVTEEEVGGLWYVKVSLKAYGTLISLH
jgi:autotransporter-associated beta strand protein